MEVIDAVDAWLASASNRYIGNKEMLASASLELDSAITGQDHDQGFVPVHARGHHHGGAHDHGHAHDHDLLDDLNRGSGL